MSKSANGIPTFLKILEKKETFQFAFWINPLLQIFDLRCMVAHSEIMQVIINISLPSFNEIKFIRSETTDMLMQRALEPSYNYSKTFLQS